jgi:hypothetical protein
MEFSVQEDHLHSSPTLWQPYSPNHYVSVKWYILPSLVFLTFAACHMLYRYYMQALEAPPITNRTIVYTSIILSMAALPQYSVAIAGIAALWMILTKPFAIVLSPTQLLYCQLLMATIEILVSVYFTIYFNVWAYVSCAVTLLILLPRKLTITLLLVGVAGLVWAVPHYLLL